MTQLNDISKKPENVNTSPEHVKAVNISTLKASGKEQK